MQMNQHKTNLIWLAFHLWSQHYTTSDGKEVVIEDLIDREDYTNRAQKYELDIIFEVNHIAISTYLPSDNCLVILTKTPNII